MTEPVTFLGGRVTLHAGDCLTVLATMPEASIDSVVTDPPYHLTANKKGGSGVASVNLESPYGRAKIGTGNGAGGFMGKAWDGGDIAFDPATWAAIMRVLKPGGHLVAFGAPRNAHRLTCAIEDAGFEIRDCLMWIFGSGFPKSLNVSKAIDKAAGDTRPVIASEKVRDIRNGHGRGMGDGINAAERDGPTYMQRDITSAASAAWDGWGTALKPAFEPIILARKPLIGTVAENVLAHGTGALNIDGCRVATDETGDRAGGRRPSTHEGYQRPGSTMFQDKSDWSMPTQGRWPANIIHDGSEEVLAAFPDAPGALAPVGPQYGPKDSVNFYRGYGPREQTTIRGDSGSAARFFYTAKADSDDRIASKHPTVKPIDLMRWLCRLITPPGGIILDTFAGTGTTGEAAYHEGFKAILIEREPEYQADIARRMSLVLAGPEERKRTIIAEKAKGKPVDAGPLFGASA